MARIALTLGSGGARGYAHIGVIEELLERGHEVVAVSGASMGALVGGLHAAGGLAEFTAWARTLRQRDVLRLIDPSWSAPGAVAADKIMERCHEIVGDVRIEQLAVPTTVVATDLLARRELWLQQGPLIPAIRASIAIPGVIAPSVLDGRVLVDGGLLNPVPIEPTAATAADLRVAVSLLGPRDLPAPAVESVPGRRDGWYDRVRASFGRATTGDGSDPVSPDSNEAAEAVVPDSPGLRTSDVTSLSMDAVQNIVARYRMAAFPPDVLITVPFSAARTIDFHRADELITLGRRLAAEALDG